MQHLWKKGASIVAVLLATGCVVGEEQSGQEQYAIGDKQSKQPFTDSLKTLEDSGWHLSGSLTLAGAIAGMIAESVVGTDGYCRSENGALLLSVKIGVHSYLNDKGISLAKLGSVLVMRFPRSDNPDYDEIEIAIGRPRYDIILGNRHTTMVDIGWNGPNSDSIYIKVGRELDGVGHYFKTDESGAIVYHAEGIYNRKGKGKIIIGKVVWEK